MQDPRVSQPPQNSEVVETKRFPFSRFLLTFSILVGFGKIFTHRFTHTISTIPAVLSQDSEG
jgi:hypothetical protein